MMIRASIFPSNPFKRKWKWHSETLREMMKRNNIYLLSSVQGIAWQKVTFSFHNRLCCQKEAAETELTGSQKEM